MEVVPLQRGATCQQGIQYMHDITYFRSPNDRRSGPALREAVRPVPWRLPGFASATRIRTTLGDIPAGLLRRGDEVVTPSGVTCPIAWIDRMSLDAEFLAAQPAAKPWIVPAGALGDGLPAADLIVSGGQMLGGSRVGHKSREVSGLDVAETRHAPAVQYTLFHCGQPVRVFAEGVWCDVDELSTTKGRQIA